MFSLIQFENGELLVTESKKIQKKKGSRCTAKFKGGRFEADVISESDDKNYLTEYSVSHFGSFSSNVSAKNSYPASSLLCDATVLSTSSQSIAKPFASANSKQGIQLRSSSQDLAFSLKQSFAAADISMSTSTKDLKKTQKHTIMSPELYSLIPDLPKKQKPKVPILKSKTKSPKYFGISNIFGKSNMAFKNSKTCSSKEIHNAYSNKRISRNQTPKILASKLNQRSQKPLKAMHDASVFSDNLNPYSPSHSSFDKPLLSANIKQHSQLVSSSEVIAVSEKHSLSAADTSLSPTTKDLKSKPAIMAHEKCSLIHISPTKGQQRTAEIPEISSIIHISPTNINPKAEESKEERPQSIEKRIEDISFNLSPFLNDCVSFKTLCPHSKAVRDISFTELSDVSSEQSYKQETTQEISDQTFLNSGSSLISTINISSDFKSSFSATPTPIVSPLQQSLELINTETHSDNFAVVRPLSAGYESIPQEQSHSNAIISLDNNGQGNDGGGCCQKNSESSNFKNVFNSTESTAMSTNKTVSEYFPESTIEITEELDTTKNNSVEKSNSELDVPDPIVLSTIKVLHRSKACKKHFCIFCKTLQTKLARHFFIKHTSEREVKQAFNLPIKSKERLQIINNLRKQGDFLHNTKEEHNSGILIVSRQQQLNRKNTADNYVCCRKCKGFYAKNALRNHLNRCGKETKNARDNLIYSRKLTQYIHKDANATVRNKIFPVLRDDDVTRLIRYDHLIIVYANYLTLKHTLSHQDDMIRSRLRLLGRFLIATQSLDNNIKELKDIFKSKLFDICVKALRLVAKWDDDLRWFKTPAVAQDLSSLIKKVGKRLSKELIKVPDSDEKMKDLNNFMILWEEDIPVLINQKALEDQITQKRSKKLKLPSKDDIKKLYLYLKHKMFDAIGILEKQFNLESWTDLIKSSLISIQIFNRRRAGEIERLLIKNYLNREEITENIDKEILENMSDESLTLAKQFVRLTLRGKLGRTVSVLLSPVDVRAIELILKYRNLAGITEKNEFIFGRKVVSKFSKPYYRACPLLRQYSEECGAEFPESLRGTYLRKHIATYTSMLNIEDATVDRLANFMGHHKDIHKSIYRVSVPVAEITCISKLLLAAVGGDNEEDDDEDEDEENGNYEKEDNFGSRHKNLLNQSTNISVASNKKKRSTSPYGKTKRTRWSQDERNAISTIYGDLDKLDKLPSLKECFDVVSKNAALKNRTAVQLKTWIDNQRRKK